MLTAEEKEAGRAFRAQAQAELLASFETDPPTYTVPGFIAVYRHECPGRGGISTALELHEVYTRSPAHGIIPAGRFAYVHKRGRCQLCGHTARSRGRLVDAYARPPLRPDRLHQYVMTGGLHAAAAAENQSAATDQRGPQP